MAGPGGHHGGDGHAVPGRGGELEQYGFLRLVQRTGFFLLLLGGIFLSLFRRTGRRGFLAASAVIRGLFLAAWFGLWNAIPSLWTWFETGCAALTVTLGAELIAGWSRKPRGQ